jgi:hypothetical protein
LQPPDIVKKLHAIKMELLLITFFLLHYFIKIFPLVEEILGYKLMRLRQQVDVTC